PIIKTSQDPSACENCRRQKIKCDGGRPVCGNCSRKGRSKGDCVWKHVDGRPEAEAEAESGQPSLDMLRALEERIRHLESQGRRSSSVNTSRIHNCSSQSQSMSPGPGPGPGPGSVGPVNAGLQVPAEPQSEGFMGSASAMSIMNMIREAVDPSSPAPVATPAAAAQSVSPSTVSPSSRRTQALPTRRAAEKLAAVYWAYIHPLYPFLYKPHFQAIIRNIWDGEPLPEDKNPATRTSETNNLCLFNLVLALACQYHNVTEYEGNIDDGRKAGAALFDRARSLFSHKIADGNDQNPPSHPDHATHGAVSQQYRQPAQILGSHRSRHSNLPRPEPA
ncbi:hypothetical protein F5X68DRAFT_238184, partial [Plectosphaerella plurivora]